MNFLSSLEPNIVSSVLIQDLWDALKPNHKDEIQSQNLLTALAGVTGIKVRPIMKQVDNEEPLPSILRIGENGRAFFANEKEIDMMMDKYRSFNLRRK